MSKLVKKVWVAEKEVGDGMLAPLAITVTVMKMFTFSEANIMEQIHASLPDVDGWVFRKNGE